MMLMSIPASSSSPPPHLSPSSSSYTNPLLPVFTSTVAAAVLLPTSHATPTTTYSNFKSVRIEGRTTRRRRRGVSSSDNQTVVEAPAATTSSSSAAVESPSLEVVRNFYGGINGHDLASVEDLIALDCVYEDLIFSRPFVGRKAILEFFQKFIDSISMDLQFVIDDISHEDTSALGVTWHLEWKGKPFPFSKGCSFYRLEMVNGKRQIIYGRDCVEPAFKPGEMALVDYVTHTSVQLKIPD
ncbi:hypothetical protein RHMOL_Rhmol08G0137600 [Rhododendron molle]|uniref:Uncharacterized protein n=1 Tax=Rhododendron molle TaxID=49168 RepID=A0ACC0MN88_RHOML|nr:hypothetical protein RHMOL_Rhmol08G0137600 [Rhododendron molle]